MTDHHIRTTCRLCGSTRLETLLELPDTPLANELLDHPDGGKVQESPGHVTCYTLQRRFPLYLVGCESCGHVQLPVVVDPKRLFPPDYPYQSGTSAVFRAHLKGLAEVLAGEVAIGGQVLDIACNDGTLCGMIADHGINACGIDPAAPCKTGYWREFFTERWAQEQAPLGKFDCITMLNAFAHIDDLDDIVRGVKVLLEPGGLFVVEVAYLPDMVRAGIWDTIYLEHLCFHHLSPLVRFFQRHGMTLTDAHRIDSQGGSVRIFVRNGEGAWSTPRLRSLLEEESRADLWGGVRRLRDSVDRVRELIQAAAARAGGKLAVYGAPAKLCTLLHATGTTELVDFVADDNPLKVGRFVPGTAIPIRPVAELYERRPRVVLIASWNFGADIMSRHAELGCEWVVPFGGE